MHEDNEPLIADIAYVVRSKGSVFPNTFSNVATVTINQQMPVSNMVAWQPGNRHERRARAAKYRRRA